MTRVYIAKTRLSLSITFQNGYRKMIAFTPLSTGGSTYKTSNSNEIEAIEKNGMFNELFRAEDNEKVDEEADVTDGLDSEYEVDLTVNADITNLADARLLLKESGSKVALQSRVSILDEAKKMGYSFPNLK